MSGSTADRYASVKTALQIILLAISSGFVIMIGVAISREPFGPAISAIASSMWGLVTLIDLSMGLAFVGFWIAVMERRLWPTIGWWICLLCLGNLATVAYLLVRLRKVDEVTAVFTPSSPEHQPSRE